MPSMRQGRQGAVLVVDDEEIMREILETLLTREGYEVRVGKVPFAAMVQIPVDVFLEQAEGVDLAGALLLQVAWAVVLLGLARTVLAAALRRVVIQGG